MKKLFFVAIALVTVWTGCKKEEETPPPTANFSYKNLSSTTISFQNTSENADSYVWDFGDGSLKSSAENPSHMYFKNGVYTVVLKAKGKGGENQISKTINIELKTPSADFSYTKDGNSVPTKVTFVNKSTNATKYIWNFGDGSPVSNEENPTHTYSNKGTYFVELSAQSQEGISTVGETITIGTNSTY